MRSLADVNHADVNHTSALRTTSISDSALQRLMEPRSERDVSQHVNHCGTSITPNDKILLCHTICLASMAESICNISKRSTLADCVLKIEKHHMSGSGLKNDNDTGGKSLALIFQG